VRRRKSPFRVFILIIILLIAVGLWFFGKKPSPSPAPEPIVQKPSPQEEMFVALVPSPAIEKPKKVVEVVPKIVATPLLEFKKPVLAEPPKIEIHEELIPKEIKIVRVYYANSLTEPESVVQFDINGSGFTKEFEKMITVELESPHVTVKDLRLVTPNQIHGYMWVDQNAPTAVVFPRVLIQGKVVFLAQDPIGVIRPGEVLNLIFLSMGETGRSGHFRVFTNLTDEMYSNFYVVPSTPSITVTDLRPTLPFIVDATVTIGPLAHGGNYGLKVQLKDKTIWERDGIIRIVKPNLGETGLVQRIHAEDGYHRPGDEAKFVVAGSGFQPSDINLLRAEVEGFDKTIGTFTYVAPGLLGYLLKIPKKSSATYYTLSIYSPAEELLKVPGAFQVVGKNWTRSVFLEPDLFPGGKSSVILAGRGLEKKFVRQLEVEWDEPGLKIGKFKFISPKKASVKISAGPNVSPGDYWLRITSDGKKVEPAFGSIIRIKSRK